MNLQPLAIKDIPLGVPLPWQIYDSNGYTIFARGEIVGDEESLENLAANGLLRDMDALPEEKDAPAWLEVRDLPPAEMFPPQGIKPQVWERLQVRLLGRGAQVYYPARLIGYVKNRSILITVPEKAGQRIVIADGEALEARMLTGGNIYVFQTIVQRVCISPVHYLHLDYPARMRIAPLRRSPWATVNLTASVADARGTEEFARIVNLSPNGAQLHVPIAMGMRGELLRVAFHAVVEEMKRTLTLDALILHVRQAKPGAEEGRSLFEYGVEFRHATPEDLLWLRCLVYRRIAEGYPA